MIVIYKSKHSTQVIVREYKTKSNGEKAAIQRTAHNLETAIKNKTFGFVNLPQPLISYDILHEFKDWNEIRLYYPEHFL